MLEVCRRYVFPEYRLTDHSKLWFEDEDFFRAFDGFVRPGPQTAERKFFVKELMKLVSHLDGDTAEAGVYTGATSWFICSARAQHAGTHWGFDSFEGLSSPGALDGAYWAQGSLATGAEPATTALTGFETKLLQGWIPEVFAQAEIDRLVFAHIDVDLFEPTLASLEYFYPLLVSGGILVCDDYGFSTCPGATRAMNEYMSGRPEPIVHAPTGQGIIFKR